MSARFFRSRFAVALVSGLITYFALWLCFLAGVGFYEVYLR